MGTPQPQSRGVLLGRARKSWESSESKGVPGNGALELFSRVSPLGPRSLWDRSSLIMKMTVGIAEIY